MKGFTGNQKKTKISVHTARNIRYLVFVLSMCLLTSLSFQSLATDPPLPDIRDPVGDKNLPDWCPPATNAGLAVVCGTVVTSNVRDVGDGLELPFQPVSNVMVATYEENPDSPTGAQAGALTNVFSSTRTNEEGRFRVTIRRVNPPNLQVSVLFFCGATKVQELVVDSWHNTWNLFVQTDCNPKDVAAMSRTINTSVTGEATPPFPYTDEPQTSFLGCTNDRFTDRAVGLEQRYQPVINTVVEEDNFDHRYTLNQIKIKTNFPAFFSVGDFTMLSPGGLWEPDCLLRNKRGTYMCYTNICQDWQKYPNQPCTAGNCPEGVSPESRMINQSYSGVKLYARGDCTGGPNGEAPAEGCEEQQETDGLPENSDPIDGVMCDSGPFATDAERSGRATLDQMVPEDYITRPFFKFIPKSNAEASIPFRRFEYRNNLKDYRADPYAAMQGMDFYGNSHNSGSGLPLTTYFRGFLGGILPKPILFSCNTLYDEKMPFQDRHTATTVNGLINNGPFAGLSEYPTGESTTEEMYYSGARDLSDFLCETQEGNQVRICEIQVPWGDDQYCEIGTSGCKDHDLHSRLNKSLNRAYSATSVLTDLEKEKVKQNIQNTIAKCTGPYKLNKLHWRFDKIFGTGNSQVGLHSETPNDSIPPLCERRSQFDPAASEQACPPLTGSRVALQEGGDTKGTSYNSVASAIDPKHAINNMTIPSFGDVLTAPFASSELIDKEEEKKRYFDQSTWTINVVGGNQTSTCSISNAYDVDIKGPDEERNGLASSIAGNNEADMEGGFFDQLFTGNNQHRQNWEVGTATWYMSDQAVKRDAAMQGASLGIAFPGDEIRVGVSSGIVNGLFNSLLVRDIWDSMLTFASGDAHLHGLNFELKDITGIIVDSLGGPSKWKSFGDRKLGGGDEALGSQDNVATKPFYSVTWQYPLTEAGFKESFKLPGLQPDGSYVQSDLRPEEWGPGHECYNFDTIVPQGKVGGTTREQPEGVSRTTRLDKCVAFHRVETVKCRCNGDVVYGSTGELTVTGIKCRLDTNTREDRHLAIADCTRDNRLWCAQRQETSRTWENWKGGYDDVNVKCDLNNHNECNFGYYRDTREGDETTGILLPPDDIDHADFNPDDVHDSDYDPPYIPDSACYPDLMNWDSLGNKEAGDTITKTKTLSATGPTRPRCWASTAGPFRKNPNFSAANTTAPEPEFAGGEIKNCNGFIKIEDSALRMNQYPPYEQDTTPEGNPIQDQVNLNRSVQDGLKVSMAFSPPWTKSSWSNTLSLLYSEETNDNGPAAGLAANFWTQRLKQKLTSVFGGRALIKSFFAYPSVKFVTNAGAKLQPLTYHCDYQSTYTLTNYDGKQVERRNVLGGYDPDFDKIDGWICRISQPPVVQIPDVSVNGSDCEVPQFGRCSQFFRDTWIKAVTESKLYSPTKKAEMLADLQTFQFPIYFRNMITWAAEQSKTPAGALMAVLYLEGGLSDPTSYKYWGDNATVFNMGVPWWGQMDIGGPATCNNLEWTATGPYKLIKHWTTCLVEPDNVNCDNGAEAQERARLFCGLLGHAGGGRCESVLSGGRCNFLDASMVSAFLMNPQAGKSSSSCRSFDLNAALSRYSGGTYSAAAKEFAQSIYSACGPQ